MELTPLESGLIGGPRVSVLPRGPISPEKRLWEKTTTDQKPVGWRPKRLHVKRFTRPSERGHDEWGDLQHTGALADGPNPS